MTITYSQVDDLRFLSPHIPDLNAGDGMKTGIYKAVEKGNYEMIKFLTSKVKDPSTAQHVSFIPIHIAAYLGHTAIVELLAGFYDTVFSSLKVELLVKNFFASLVYYR